MPDNAHYLAAHLDETRKTVIFTGAWIPLYGFTLSDGGFNLGYAMAQLDCLPPGIYVAMNGQVLKPGNVMKLLDEGRFESIPTAGGSLERREVHIVVTGGTLDSRFHGKLDCVVPRENTILPTFFDHVKVNWTVRYDVVCMKDSRDLSKEDRDDMLETILRNPCQRVMLTHGLYTMPDTADFLIERLRHSDKVVVITGSKTPLDFPMPDATFNLGFALGKAETLEPGVYIALEGRLIQPDEMRQSLDEAVFQNRFTESAAPVADIRSIDQPATGSARRGNR